MTIRPYDAWVLSRLLCGFAFNGELEAVSTPFRPLAHHLAVRSAEARQDDWEAFLTGRDDRDQIIMALANIDPLGPAPEADADDDEAAPPADWPEEPRPVRHELRPVLALRPEMIPDPLRGWLVDIAERVSCPLEFPAVGALEALAIVIGRKVAIRPKRHDDWTVVPNLWGAVVGRPGVLKTPALTEATKPLRRLEAEARRRHEDALTKFQAEALVAEVQVDAARKALKEAAKGKKPEAVLQALARDVAQAAAPPEPSLRRYTTSDPTVEKLGELLRDHGSIGLIRDELTGWLRSFEKSDRQCDRAFYLESWNGNGLPFTYDRIGRGTILIPSPCVSILGGMQPGPLRKLVRWVARGEEADDGLISRFQLLLWPDPAGEWRNVDRWPDTDAKNRASAVFQALDALDPSAIDASPDEDGGPPFLRFDPEAQDLFDSWRAGLEAKLRAPEQSPLIESHLAKYRSLMPSLALLFHLIDVADGAGVSPVSLRSAELALAWCNLLEAHARRVYVCVAAPDLESAIALSERIKAGALPSPFQHRDVYRKCWSNLDSPEAARRAVAVLEDLDWLHSVAIQETGGAPRVDIQIHPKLPRKAPGISEMPAT
jgi:Protein of unknown function (DUF3987)